MFKIGDKAKGFKFDSDTDSVNYDNDMDDYVGVIGEVVESWKDSFVILFPDQLEWMYPASLWNLAKVEEITSFDVGEDVSFKVGDKVKFKKSSIDSGMIDATENDVFEVYAVFTTGLQIDRGDYFQVFAFCHLEHVKESVMTNTGDAMNNTEEQEIKWEVGQEVFCCVFGKGIVIEISKDVQYPLRVSFEHEENTDEGYTMEGKLYTTAKNRTLFFSEPKIEAEKFPPKKPFVPTLKEGDEILIEGPRGGQIFRREVKEETEDKVICKYAGEFEKIGYKFTKLGEEIIFD